MFLPIHFKRFIFLVISILLFQLTLGCTNSPTSLPTPSPTAISLPTNTLPAPSATPIPSPTSPPPPTATLVPTATMPPTATPIPTPTAQPESLTVWCLPKGVVSASAPTSGSAPKEAKLGVTSGKNTVNVPAPSSSCTFTYRFSQPVSNGMELQVYDRSSAPWLKLKLQAVAGNPATAVVTLTHEYIIDPPFWSIDYRFVVRDASGAEKRSDTIRILKPLPPKCPHGGYPDPVTYYCDVTNPKEPEPHPDQLEYFKFWFD